MSQGHFVVTLQISYRIEGPPCNHLTFRDGFHEMTVECDPRTQHFETLFPRPSMVTVSDTVIVASRLSGADEHHTASSHAIRSPAFSRSSFHARAQRVSSAGGSCRRKAIAPCSSRPWAAHTSLSGTFHKKLLPKCPVLPQTDPLHTGHLAAPNVFDEFLGSRCRPA